MAAKDTESVRYFDDWIDVAYSHLLPSVTCFLLLTEIVRTSGEKNVFHDCMSLCRFIVIVRYFFKQWFKLSELKIVLKKFCTAYFIVLLLGKLVGWTIINKPVITANGVAGNKFLSSLQTALDFVWFVYRIAHKSCG